MNVLALIAVGFACLALALHIGSAALATWRCRKGRVAARPRVRPPVSLVRPLRGVEPCSRETIAASFTIRYPDYEILFCVADADDPVVSLVREAIDAHPQARARLLVGDDVVSSNPKLNNMAKGFYAARGEVIVFVDSNVLTPTDYLDQLVASLERGAGMVTAPPVGYFPQDFAAQLECAFLNSYQARVQYAVDALGYGFAQGKTLCFRRRDLEGGGFARLALEPAEDAAATKMMREAGKPVWLAGPFAQIIGPRSWSQVWARQLRWARLRRASFPLLFAPEICAGALPPFVAIMFAAYVFELPQPPLAAAFLALWYLPEVVLIRLAGWPLSLSALALRDALLPAIYVGAWIGRDFEWHGRRMRAVRAQEDCAPGRGGNGQPGDLLAPKAG